MFFIKSIFLVPIILLAGLASYGGCSSCREVALSGKTMGTSYHLNLCVSPFVNVGKIKKAIDMRLEEINACMSTYRPESDISRFNAFRESKKRPFSICGDMLQVLTLGVYIHTLTGGAWDGTIMPLVKLWGFNDHDQRRKIPSTDAIKNALSHVGFSGIEISPEGWIQKNDPLLALDVASIAKGYGVDQVAALLDQRGIKNFLVEIGGEVYARGLRQDEKPWRVGINKPIAYAPIDAIYKVVGLRNRAFATSGDYRIFFEIGGHRYSHIIDPSSGYPVNNQVVSVSVEAEQCALADGLATALMVMGPTAGVQLVNNLNSVECLIVTMESDGSLKSHLSRNFRTLP